MTQIEARTGILRWVTAGSEQSPGLILLHSLGTDAEMWDPQLEALSELRQVVLIDLPGHGRSTAAPPPYRLDDLGEDVLDVATSVGLDSFDVGGVSLGGLIALWLAAYAPGRVTRLICANTAAKLGSEELWTERIRAVEAGGMEAIRDAVVPRFFAPGFSERYPEQFEKMLQTFTDTDPAGYIGCCGALRDADLRDEVSKIRCPTLIIGGEADIATPPATARWLHRHIQGSQLELIGGAAHLSNLDQPETFTRLVVSALNA